MRQLFKPTHGMWGSPEYKSWYKMKYRCLNPRHVQYHNYGGRGILVCERWYKFENFFADMGKKPTPEHTLERIDSNGNYEPSNCRWATMLEQANNKKTTVRITYKGRTQSMKDWCRELGLNYMMVRERYVSKWTPEEMFERPRFSRKHLNYKKHEEPKNGAKHFSYGKSHPI